MEINIIGSGSIGATDMSASTLIDKKILVDVPNGIVKHIKKLGYNTGEIESILITHLHGDHFFDIPFFMFDRYFQKNDNLVCIYCPKGTKEKVKLLFDIGFPGDFDRINHAINVKFVEFDGESKIEGKDFVAYSKYVEHGNFEPAYGYIINLNNKKIGFSGDSKLCNAIENIVADTDISILDMSHAQNVSPSHMGIEDIKYLCNKYKNKTIISTHMHEYTKGQALRLNIKNFIVGKDNLKNLNGFNLIFRSPSCLPTRPELRAEEEKGAIVTTEIEMLMKMCPCKIIGVTGSEGKTTTTSLIYAILKHAGYNTYLGGNIGTPLFTKLSEILPDDIVVLELSSFQLMEMEVSPNISVITNITPNHLNIHSSYEEYIEAKKTIFKYQTQDDTLILNYDNEITRKCKPEANSKVIYFSSKEKLNDGYIVDGNIIKECENKLRKHILNTKEIKLRGTHNFENICAALAATRELVDEKTAVEAIKEFNSVEHRLEFVREINGVKWYNDSASSSPSRTIAGLNAYDEEIVLIAGGYDKNLDYDILGKYIVKKVKALVLIGNTAKKILDATTKEMEKQGVELPICFCQTLEDAVKEAKQVAKENQVVLFSPASASFDMFKNFADRGNQFKKLVNEL